MSYTLTYTSYVWLGLRPSAFHVPTSKVAFEIPFTKYSYVPTPDVSSTAPMLIMKLLSVISVILGSPIVGFSVSLFTVITLVGLVFPACSIDSTCTSYSPSSFIGIGVCVFFTCMVCVNLLPAVSYIA